MRNKNQRIIVDFSRAPRHTTPFQSPERRYGGCGILTVPHEPYSGPPVMGFQAVVGKENVRFTATRMERSPTGSAHGSFRIDELRVNRKGEEYAVTLGYNCSWPDAEVCRRLAVEHRQS